MANELFLAYSTGQTIYGVVVGTNRAQRWNGSAFALTNTFNNSQWGTSGRIDFTEQETSEAAGTGWYVGTFPVGITAKAQYIIALYLGSVDDSNWIGNAVYGPGESNILQIEGHTLAGTGSQIADGFEHFFDVATPAQTMNDVGSSGASATDIWNHVLDGTITAGVMLKIVAALLGGEGSYDKSTGTWTVKARDGSTTIATIVLGDTPGNRTSSTFLGE